MPQWTLLGLLQGKQTAPWPLGEGDDGQEGFIGMPRFHPELCGDECKDCADACPTRAITMRPNGAGRLDIDYGRCIVCQLCTEACPTGAMAASGDWALGVRRRADLVWREGGKEASATPGRPPASAAACMCAMSMPAPATAARRASGAQQRLLQPAPARNLLHRLAALRRPAAGDRPVTCAMLEPLRATYEAMAEPRWVMAVGTCAVSGGIAEGGYASGHGLEGVLPVDVYLPGCPPNPAAIIEALLMFLDRLPQRVKGGRLVE